MRNTVSLDRALSKLGILSRAAANRAIKAGQVRVNGRTVVDPSTQVAPESALIEVDGAPRSKAAWRALVFYKPRGVVTTRSDPQGRPTIYDVLGAAGEGLIAVGRLDMATSGLLLLTTDTQLANWITDPANAVARTYLVSVRGNITEPGLATLTCGIGKGRERIRATAVTVRKASSRESHLVVELREGRNREVRRLFEAIGHPVTRLKRVSVGRLDLGDLRPGEWRPLSPADVSTAFPLWKRKQPREQRRKRPR